MHALVEASNGKGSMLFLGRGGAGREGGKGGGPRKRMLICIYIYIHTDISVYRPSRGEPEPQTAFGPALVDDKAVIPPSASRSSALQRRTSGLPPVHPPGGGSRRCAFLALVRRSAVSFCCCSGAVGPHGYDVPPPASPPTRSGKPQSLFLAAQQSSRNLEPTIRGYAAACGTGWASHVVCWANHQPATVSSPSSPLSLARDPSDIWGTDQPRHAPSFPLQHGNLDSAPHWPAHRRADFGLVLHGAGWIMDGWLMDGS
ncbi:hypothetical protein CDD83_7362 [Cordyceps sp. RAO-2017]|nr:hypothetical protein CDD83_7362 [Cordyceps sp. RAO-2017]